jgi:hypothetical protein
MLISTSSLGKHLLLERVMLNISSYAKNLLLALTPSEPEFSVFDYIWEEIKSISETLKSVVVLVLISCS